MSEKRGNFSSRAQVTIFIIIALVIVAGVIAYLLLKDRLGVSRLSEQFQPIEQYFLSCIQEQAEIGAGLLGSQAGYITPPEFEAGSEYRPFSSQLDFFGSSVPYWYYLAGNNIIKEQIPSKSGMEKELADFLLETECDFGKFEAEGYEVSLVMKKANAKINDNSVDISVDAELEINFADESGKQSKHNTEIKSSLGNFYDEALNIYNYEKQNMFLENYAVDVLRLYAPVDGVELDCASKIWLKDNVDKDLKQALEANMQAVKLKGDYYTLKNKDNKYFVVELPAENSVNFLYSPDWTTRIEVWDAENGVMLAEPVGLQAGLGVLGFCYVPYHFVYDINYPVLIQIYNNDELFQFPVAVIIEKNKPREALPASNIADSEPELCKYKTNSISVYTYNNNLDAVEADISFNCLMQTCDIGKTKIENNDAVLEAKFPACVNGWIIARADDYAYKKYLISTNEESVADIILDRLYNISLDLKVDGSSTQDFAIISFSSEENSQTLVWPEQKQVRLSEGYYNISVYVYRKGSITIPGMKNEQCVDAPKSGLAGIFGMTEEKCFNVDIPSQTLENVVAGGGKGSDYFVESQLETGKMEIRVSSIPIPISVDALQDSYNRIEAGKVYVEFAG